MDYEGVIGLEVHVELKTASKLFCGCPTAFGAAPNTQTCPVCLGLPGVLPVLNEKAIEYAIMVGLAFGCDVAPFSKFDRKNYFYPDLPKNYQISQYDKPLCTGGAVEMACDGVRKRIGLVRVHLEEEAGKLFHFDDGESGVDFNRVGIPLLEIVSQPQIASPDEAYHYLTALRNLVRYVGVSDCNMEEGTLRCDANVSVRPKGSTGLGVKTEIKNMNTINGVRRALAYEIERQINLLKAGDAITVQETRRWDPESQTTQLMRSKEEAHDYRYFPEPDLVPMVLSREFVERMRARLPELPLARRDRFVSQYSLSEYDAGVLTAEKAYADFFEAAVKHHHNPKAISNWVQSELLGALNAAKTPIEESRITPQHLAGLVRLIDEGTISGKMAKTVFEEMFQTGKAPQAIVADKGLVQITDGDAIANAVDEVLASLPNVVAEYKSGKERAFGFLIGQIMKATKGKANPQLVNNVLKRKLSGS